MHTGFRSSQLEISVVGSGPTSSEVAKMKAPHSLRAQFGTDCTRNACHGSDSHECARLVINLLLTQICQPKVDGS